jgi:hypothetical protein
MKQFLIISALGLLSFFSNAQINTVQLQLEERKFPYSPVKDKNVKVIINDTLERKLITNEKGVTGFLEVPDGNYSMKVLVDQYKEYYIKKVKVSKANGKHLKLKLDKI